MTLFVLKYKPKLLIFRRTIIRVAADVRADWRHVVRLVAVYRPDPASAVTHALFVNWADVLENTLAFAGCRIVGDVNPHVSDVTNSVHFHSLLNSFNLCDHA